MRLPGGAVRPAMKLTIGIDCLQDRLGSERRWHEDNRRVASCCFLCLSDIVEDWKAEMLLATLSWGDSSNHLGSILDCLLRVEGALLPGEALADDLGVLVDKDCRVVSCGEVACQQARDWLGDCTHHVDEHPKSPC